MDSNNLLFIGNVIFCKGFPKILPHLILIAMLLDYILFPTNEMETQTFN